MPQSARISSPYEFSLNLFEKMKEISPAVGGLEIYEFQYCLENVIPKAGWQSVSLEPAAEIEKRVNDLEFYKKIEICPRVDGHSILDPQVLNLMQMLFAGLVDGTYTADWVSSLFYFDVRGFYFLHRTRYYNAEVFRHFNGKPFAQFPQNQDRFNLCQGVGYKEFKAANLELDKAFIHAIEKLIGRMKTPIVLAIAGPTAAGKTEIVARLRESLANKRILSTAIELDNFFTDRDYREANDINSESKRALHMDRLVEAFEGITRGERIRIPRYDFIAATSSHDLHGNLKPGAATIEIEPADIVFIEGNFPFLIDEIAPHIGIKVVYLTEDSVRLKRKWKRDMDYRKKYDLNYFRNRFFKDQFIMAEVAYTPQMEVCDLLVDTTGAAIWATPAVSALLERE